MAEKSITWKVVLSSHNAEASAALVSQIFPSGVELLSATEFCAYYSGEGAQLRDLFESLRTLGIRAVTHEEYNDKNWIQHCRELWHEVQIDALRLVPVADATEIDQHSNDSIFIVPGTGFGTGHHESTQLALELLQSSYVQEQAPHTALDVGTGNGVLALALRKLYGTRVDALDIDSLAIENAKQNIDLNNAGDLIGLHRCELGPRFPAVSILTANIYAEVLCSLASDFTRHLIPNGLLVVSGISSSAEQMVRECFTAPDWNWLECRKKNEWCAALLEKHRDRQ